MNYEWAVIGAGPAGIAAVGQLLDHGVPAKDIAWIDPAFKVGDFGTRWRHVPSNTKVELFLKFLNACAAFDYQQAPVDFELNHAPKSKTCELRLMADPLQWVSDHLQTKVHAIVDHAEELELKKRVWHIKLKHNHVTAKHVILAVGAEPKSLSYPALAEIPLSIAMDKEKLKKEINPDEAIAVFGSSHSAVLVLRNLVENGAKKIINFYRSPLLYAVYLSDWILFDDSGLKGPTAEWARQYLDGDLPANLQRIYSNRDNVQHHLPHCDRAVYAVGFERRASPVVVNSGPLEYIEQAGIIAPGLFGFGIGFPEAKTNPLGITEYRVGLWKFMEYLQRVMPIWLKYSP